MGRTFAAIACVLLASGFASAGERSRVHDAAHEDDRDQDGAVAKLRLQRMLADIIESQKQYRDELERRRHDHRPSPPPPREPRIGVSPVVVIEKGGSATVRHTITWGASPDDALAVTVNASDSSLVVPEKLTLDFEKHQFRFEYQVKAGAKAGEFTVTLTPTAGKPVTVKVLVK